MRNFFRECKEKQKKINELQSRNEQLNKINEILEKHIKAFDERENAIIKQFIEEGRGVANINGKLVRLNLESLTQYRGIKRVTMSGEF